MSVRSAHFILTIAITLPAIAQITKEADVKAYHECVAAATDADVTPGKAVETCLAPAKAGIPGAQYALGTSLVSRNEAGDRTAGIEWLEKSAGSGHPAAAFTLAGILLQEQSPASQARGRDFLKAAVCAGYPYALSALRQAGVKRENVGCLPVPEEDFAGEWIADLKWVKSGAVSPEVSNYQLKIIIESDAPRVFAKFEGTWKEVKSGRFNLEKHGQSATVGAVDRGWDFDGEWIESWTIQLLRTGRDEAYVAHFLLRAFSSFAEGSARRSKN